MDKNREILVDLIASKTCFRYSKDCMLRKKRGCSACYCGSCRLGTLVDHLVDNGVRVQNPQAPIKHVVDTEGIRIGNAIWRSGTTVYKCPQCGNFISRLYDYCYKCGQALDWSDVGCTTIADGEDKDVPSKNSIQATSNENQAINQATSNEPMTKCQQCIPVLEPPKG